MLRTKEELQAKLDNLVSFYQVRNQNMIAWRDLYFQKEECVWTDEQGVYIDPEQDEERIVLPIPSNTVEGFRELLLTKNPSVSVPAATEKGEDLQKAEHNEQALQAVWELAHVNETLRDSLWHGLTDGWGVVQLIWRKENEDVPFDIISRDPYYVFALPGEKFGDWKYVIHAYPRLAADLKDEWPKDGDMRKRANRVAQETIDELKDTDLVTYVEYWDKDTYACVVNYTREGEFRNEKGVAVTSWLQEPTKHNYGFLPWVIYLPCRLPFCTVGERMGPGILNSMRDMVLTLDRIISQKATMITRWQDPPLVTITEAGPAFQPTRSEAGMHLRLRTGEDAKYLVHPGPMPQMDALLAYLAEQIEVTGLPRALQGLYVGNVSGIAMSLMRNPTLMKIAFKQKEIEAAMVSLNVMILKLLEKHLGKPMELWGHNSEGANISVTVDPERIAGYYRNEVKLSASLPSDDASTVNMLATMVQLRILSRQTARDVAQKTLHDLVPQSLIAEEKRILAEMIYEDQGMVMGLAQEVAKEVNLPYLQTQKNPMGGHGEASVGMPSRTLPSQGANGLPGHNTEPTMQQRLQEMGSAPAVESPGNPISQLLQEVGR